MRFASLIPTSIFSILAGPHMHLPTTGSKRVTLRKLGRYMPHQGAREMARRVRQRERIAAKRA